MGNNISYKINYIVTWGMALTLLLEYDYPSKIMVMQNVSSERSEISNAECWSFTKLKLIKYNKIMWCVLLWLVPEINVH
jgi:hypothetical protein